jgi:carbamoyl-phosphate synthase large subunit
MVGDLKSRPAVFPPEVIYRQGDLNQLSKNELAAFQPELFIHLAATFERSVESYQFWEENYWHNIRLSHHLMTIAKDLPSLKRVVFASSYLIYDPSLYQFDRPRQDAVALSESDPVLPRNLTGMAKFAHEVELRFIDQFGSSQLTTICARIYRGYGCGSRDIISRWIRALLNREKITAYAVDGVFDYIYAADSAEGLIRLADAEDVTGIVNLGTGRARKVQDILQILRNHFPEMKIETESSDIAYEASQADMSRFERQIGWRPAYDLETAIPIMIAYEREQLDVVSPRPFPCKVLVSSASKKVPLIKSMQAAARRIDASALVVAGDIAPEALSSYVADEFWLMPKTLDENLTEIIGGCLERKITTVLPTRDAELSFWARHARQFQLAGIEVIVSNEEAVNVCLDKWKFSQKGIELGICVIPSELSPEEIGEKNIVVKERFGAGSRAIGINLGLAEAKTHAEKLQAPIFQRHVEGVEISVDAWLDRHRKVKGLVLRKRDYVVHGESQVTTTFSDPGLEAQAKHALEEIGLRGPVVLQGIIDSKSRLHIIECNPRFGGASTTGIGMGLDCLYWSLLEAAGADVSDYPFQRVAGEMRQVRVPSDISYYSNDSDL